MVTTNRSRDTQRGRLYNAETAALRMHGTDFTVPEMQALVDKWCASKVLQRRYPKAARPPTVTDGRGRRRGGHAHARRELRMPRMTRTRAYLLHELAHYLAWRRDLPAHGWEFAECYLYLVRVYLGRGQEEVLKEQFKAHRVRFRAPRRSSMTQEQREAARQRMLALHTRRQLAPAGPPPTDGRR